MIPGSGRRPARPNGSPAERVPVVAHRPDVVAEHAQSVTRLILPGRHFPAGCRFRAGTRKLSGESRQGRSVITGPSAFMSMSISLPICVIWACAWTGAVRVFDKDEQHGRGGLVGRQGRAGAAQERRRRERAMGLGDPDILRWPFWSSVGSRRCACRPGRADHIGVIECLEAAHLCGEVRRRSGARTGWITSPSGVRSTQRSVKENPVRS